MAAPEWTLTWLPVLVWLTSELDFSVSCSYNVEGRIFPNIHKYYPQMSALPYQLWQNCLQTLAMFPGRDWAAKFPRRYHCLKSIHAWWKLKTYSRIDIKHVVFFPIIYYSCCYTKIQNRINLRRATDFSFRFEWTHSLTVKEGVAVGTAKAVPRVTASQLWESKREGGWCTKELWNCRPVF